MKLVTKWIAKRVQYWLNNIICETQNAFVLGRLTIYNALVGFEVISSILLKKKERKGL